VLPDLLDVIICWIDLRYEAYSECVAPVALPHVNTLARELAEAPPVRLNEIDTVFQALSRLRGNGSAERAVYFYVIDSEDRLVGVAPIRRLLLAEPSTLVGEIMVHPAISVTESKTFGHAMSLLAEHRLLALPVVDENGRLTGVIDISELTGALVDMERKETAEQLYRSSAQVSIIAGMLAAAILSVLRIPDAARVLCLIPLIIMFERLSRLRQWR
jgi:Mg/Co/Ni transporter MgtE